MRVLVPYIDAEGRSIEDGVTTGGVERFVKDLAAFIPEVSTVSLWKGDRKANTSLMRNAVQAVSPDLIMNNYPTSVIDRVADEFGVPLMTVCHSTAGFISSLGRVEGMSKRGGAWFVSDYQYKRWKKLADRRGVPLECHGVLRPSLVREPPKLSMDMQWSCATIGRAAPRPDKHPFLLHSLLDGSDLTSLVMTNAVDSAYFHDSMARWRDVRGRETLLNLPHSAVLTNAGRAETFMVTWPDETLGAVALEALSQGTPVVLVAKGRNGELSHASECLVDDPRHYRMVSSRAKGPEVVEVVRGMDKSLDLRVEIAETAWQKFGIKTWREGIYSSLERAAKVPSSSGGITGIFE